MNKLSILVFAGLTLVTNVVAAQAPVTASPSASPAGTGAVVAATPPPPNSAGTGAVVAATPPPPNSAGTSSTPITSSFESITLWIVGIVLLVYGFSGWYLQLSGRGPKLFGGETLKAPDRKSYPSLPVTYYTVSGTAAILLSLVCALPLINGTLKEHGYLMIVLLILIENILLSFFGYAIFRVFRGYKSLSEYSVFGSVFVLILGSVCFLPAVITLSESNSIKDVSPNDVLGMVLGVIIVVTSGLLTSVLQQKDFALHVSKHLGSKLDGIADFTHFYQQFREEWGHKTLREMTRLFERKETDNCHVRTALCDSISAALRKWDREVQDGWSEPYSLAQERERAIRLKQVIYRAEEYVYALTYDDGHYLINFWDSNETQAYLDANNVQSKRVNIERIFVLGDDVLDVKATDKTAEAEICRRKRKIMKGVIADHEKYQILCIIIRKSTVINEFKDESGKDRIRSFLICDNHVASESYRKSGDVEERGYIYFTDKRSDTIESLKGEFGRLKNYEPITLEELNSLRELPNSSS